MDKKLLTEWGWIIVIILILAFVIAFASPFASFIVTRTQNVLTHFNSRATDGLDFTMPYKVKLTTNIPEAGTVFFTGEHSGTEISLEGENTVTFSATQNTGYSFVGWYNRNNLISTDMVYTDGYSVKSAQTITAKYEVKLAAGLYDANDVLISPWEELTDTYGMRATINYASNTYATETSSPYYVLTNTPELADGVKLVIGDITSISNYAFYNCANLTTVVIPDSVESIGDSSFENCTNLTTVNIPSSIETIGDSAFKNCGSLQNITISDGVTSIGKYVFESCSSLASITIPDSVETIGNNAFNKCTALKTVYYDGTIEQWCQFSFGTSSANPAWNEADLYIAGSLAKDITIPGDVENINAYAFYGCGSLTSVTLEDGITSIGKYAFTKCKNLNSVVAPDGLTTISQYAFNGCSSLASINIPDSVTTLGEGSFAGCSSLTSVNIPKGVTTLNQVFANCTSLTEIYYDAANLNDLTEQSFGVFNNAGSNGTGITFIVGKNVTKIPSYMFDCNSSTHNAPKITNIVFEEGSVCETLNAHAFQGLKELTSITLSDSVTTIGDYAFGGCSKLTNITYTGTTEQWQAISISSYWNHNVSSVCIITCSNGTIDMSGNVTPIS